MKAHVPRLDLPTPNVLRLDTVHPGGSKPGARREGSLWEGSEPGDSC